MGLIYFTFTSLAHDYERSSEDEVPERTETQTPFLRTGDMTVTTVTTADESNNNEIR
jgi:hypothetical protein